MKRRNPYILKISVPKNLTDVTAIVNVLVEKNGNIIGSRPIKCESKLRELEQILRAVGNPIEFMCQVGGQSALSTPFSSSLFCLDVGLCAVRPRTIRYMANAKLPPQSAAAFLAARKSRESAQCGDAGPQAKSRRVPHFAAFRRPFRTREVDDAIARLSGGGRC